MYEDFYYYLFTLHFSAQFFNYILAFGCYNDII